MTDQIEFEGLCVCLYAAENGGGRDAILELEGGSSSNLGTNRHNF